MTAAHNLETRTSAACDAEWWGWGVDVRPWRQLVEDPKSPAEKCMSPDSSSLLRIKNPRLKIPPLSPSNAQILRRCIINGCAVEAPRSPPARIVSLRTMSRPRSRTTAWLHQEPRNILEATAAARPATGQWIRQGSAPPDHAPPPKPSVHASVGERLA
ncbi:hypothetical protein N658DRAFT_496667 [Parathielavia hyrcaniae]|uniref:Uncharacterized protein n=1 Tax=Parathielavia hyrcaniae TaxID=113614 RepID=A0AAN6PZS4_9PEZI|nr:hypothetical protein N658DRAFT_496667 [Parathielavia hyrcaniae]